MAGDLFNVYPTTDRLRKFCLSEQYCYVALRRLVFDAANTALHKS
jgi:hypothetical protein